MTESYISTDFHWSFRIEGRCKVYLFSMAARCAEVIVEVLRGDGCW
jgi:hypothetical protein